MVLVILQTASLVWLFALYYNDFSLVLNCLNVKWNYLIFNEWRWSFLLIQVDPYTNFDGAAGHDEIGVSDNIVIAFYCSLFFSINVSSCFPISIIFLSNLIFRGVCLLIFFSLACKIGWRAHKWAKPFILLWVNRGILWVYFGEALEHEKTEVCMWYLLLVWGPHLNPLCLTYMILNGLLTRSTCSPRVTQQ